jgi:hypothetical protein
MVMSFSGVRARVCENKEAFLQAFFCGGLVEQTLAGEAVFVGVEVVDVAAGLGEAILVDGLGLGLGLEVSAVIGVGGAVLGRRG